jgi:hypothetical protein
MTRVLISARMFVIDPKIAPTIVVRKFAVMEKRVDLIFKVL